MSFKSIMKSRTGQWGGAVALSLLLSGVAVAGTTPTDVVFANLYTMIQSWITGNLAMTLVLGFALIGAIIGAARVTAMPMLTSIVVAVFFSVIVTLASGIVLGATV